MGSTESINAVNRRRVRQNGLDISQINSDSDGTCAFARPFFSKLDEPPAIKFRDPQPPQPVLKKGEAGRLGSSNGFAYLLKVFAMQLNQISECFRVPRASREGGFATIDTPLDLKRLFLGVLAAAGMSR